MDRPVVLTDFPKVGVSDLATFGGPPLFAPPISTSNLVRPDLARFLDYSRIFYEQQHYTNNGPLVRQLETRLAAFHDTQFCVCFSNGFWSLVSAITCLAVPGKSDVLMPSLTYRRLADVAAWAGLRPRFCEIDSRSLAIDPQQVETMIDDETALILAVHPIVNCCDAPALCHIAERAGLPILFDAVESVYETVAGRKVGSFGDAECFSMHASKLVNGFEGGYVTTNDPELARRLSVLRAFGFHGRDDIEMLGLNAKLSEVHAAMALAALDDLEDQVQRNAASYRLYRKLLDPISGIRLLEFDETEKTSFKNVVVELLPDWPLSRDLTIRLLNDEGALARAYYSPPLHCKPMKYPHVPADLALTESLSERFMLLPCGYQVSHDDIERFVHLLHFVASNADEIRSTATC